ncbi:hypothetical protein ACOME3_009953 [Neoechinorhynchus agilis]
MAEWWWWWWWVMARIHTYTCLAVLEASYKGENGKCEGDIVPLSLKDLLSHESNRKTPRSKISRLLFIAPLAPCTFLTLAALFPVDLLPKYLTISYALPLTKKVPKMQSTKRHGHKRAAAHSSKALLVQRGLYHRVGDTLNACIRLIPGSKVTKLADHSFGQLFIDSLLKTKSMFDPEFSNQTTNAINKTSIFCSSTALPLPSINVSL